MPQLRRRSPLLLLVAVGIAACPLLGHAETVQFPKENPAFSVEVPSGWKAGSDYFSKESGEGELQSIKPAPESANVTDEASAKAAICEIATKGASLITNPKCGDVAELTVAGHPAYSVVVAGDASIEYVIFTADGAKWFVGNSMLRKADQKDFGNKPLLDAIKPIG